MYIMYIAVYSVRLLTIERNIVKDYLFSIQVASDKKMPLPSFKKKNIAAGMAAWDKATCNQ